MNLAPNNFPKALFTMTLADELGSIDHRYGLELDHESLFKQ